MEDGCMMACGCSFCCLWIAYVACGVVALVRAFDYAQGCGWWLWVTFLVELIYVPIGVVMSLSYSGMAGAALCAMETEDVSTGNGFMDGCVRGLGFLLPNLLNGAALGFVAHSIWNESCIPSGTWLHGMALTTFWLCAVLTGVNVILAALEFVKMCCHPAAPHDAHATHAVAASSVTLRVGDGRV